MRPSADAMCNGARISERSALSSSVPLSIQCRREISTDSAMPVDQIIAKTEAAVSNAFVLDKFSEFLLLISKSPVVLQSLFRYRIAPFCPVTEKPRI